VKRIVFYIVVCLSVFSCQKAVVTSSKGLLYAVRGENPGIYDQQGRYILLRGVNYNVLGDYWQGNPDVATTKSYEPGDIALMAKYGFNCIRLLFNWSKLEPERGVYNYDYIREIKTVIEEAAKYDIYVMIDMHQDAWGKYIVSPVPAACANPNKGWDGAPEWATITDGASTCTTDGSRETAPAVYYAFQNFWDNTDSIQDACIGAWQALVKETAQYPNVVGYDLINEPGLGYKPLQQEGHRMGLYYDKLIKAVRTAENASGGLEHIIFFEGAVTWKGGLPPYMPEPNFTREKNIVFAPHHYFEVITQGILTVEQGYELYDGLAKLYKTTFLVGEWGVFGDPAVDVFKLKRFCASEDKYLVGSTWWQWAQAPGDPHGISWDGASYSNTSMHLIEVDKSGNFTGNVNDVYLKVLSRPRPNAIHGYPKKFISDPDNGMMHLQATATRPGNTTLWIPDRFGEPVISGTNSNMTDLLKVAGGYLATVAVSGAYTIDVAY
jgi:endoglycosylceramidase